MNKKKNGEVSSLKLYGRLLMEVHTLWPLLVIAVIGSIIYSACDAGSIYLLKPIINQGLQNPEYMKWIAILILILFSFRGVGSFLSSYFMGKLGASIVLKFRVNLFSKFLRLPASYYDKNSSGKLLSKLLYNVDQVTAASSSALTTIAQDGAFAIGLIINLVIISWQLSLTILVIAPFLALFIAWVSKRFRRLSKNTQTAMGRVTHVAEETLISYKEIRIFNGQKYQEEKFYKNIYYTYTQQLKTMMTDALSSPVVQMMGAIVLSAIIYIAAVYGAKSGTTNWMSPGSFVAFFTSMLALLKPIKNLTSVNSTIQKALAATEDLYQVIDTQNEIDNGKKTLEKVKGDISFNNVYFHYDKSGNDVLKNINIKIKSGKTVALVGPSGGGKTTLVSLLARFYNPTSGHITIDQIDLQELSLDNLRSHVSLVSQHVSLFDDTIFHNIAFGKQGAASQDEVIEAAKAANAWEFINAMPEGLNTMVGENGFNLSGGQRQRVAIARAILKNAPILILDEATSALDNESERLVKIAVDALMKDRTTFVIAHRLTTIENADVIAVMTHGEIVESGTHQTLLNQKGIYAKLYQKVVTEDSGAIIE